MRYWTYAEIKSKVETDLDLQSETFITPEEMLAYCNEAIDETEAEIHTLYEDYFLDSEVVSIVNGTDGYALPSNIYAHKIRDIIYRNGGNIWPLKRIRDWKKIRDYSVWKYYGHGQVTEYFIKNSIVGEPQFILSPPNLETGDFLTVWYLRNANRMTDENSVCDIPEFVSFVIVFMKYKCMQKEGHPSTPEIIADLEQQRGQMRAVLSGMVADNDTEIEADYSHYREHS